MVTDPESSVGEESACSVGDRATLEAPCFTYGVCVNPDLPTSLPYHLPPWVTISLSSTSASVFLFCK